jgi:hypothetical protein
MDPHNEVLNTSRNILDNEESKFYCQALNGPNADLWHSAIEAEMDAVRRNHTWDVVDRSTDRKIVDSKCVCKIQHLSDGSVLQIQSTMSSKEIFPNSGTGL